MSEAKAKLSAAQEALTAAQESYNAYLSEKTAIDSEVEQALSILNSNKTNKQVKQQAVFNAQEALDEARYQYETALIPDPLWIHPTYQKENTRQVPYTEMVPRVITTERTITRTTGGVTAQVYNRQGYNQAPPMPYAGESPISTQTVSHIDFSWGGDRVLDTLYEDVLIKFAGTLVVPETNYYHFYTPADDGTRLYLNNQLIINDWVDKGGGGSTSQAQYLTAGTAYPFILYYYENGGGAAVSFQYYTYSAPYYQVVPASWMGNNTITETVYEQTTVYDEVTRYRTETYYTEELVPGATAPLVSDPSLATVVGNKEDRLGEAEADLAEAVAQEQDSQVIYNESVDRQSEKAGIIVIASNDVVTKQENVYIAQQELEAIPPFREPTPTPEETTKPTKEPEIPVSPEIPEPITPTPTEKPELPIVEDPQSLTPTQVEELRAVANEILENSQPGSEEYEEALDALFVAAQADDIVLDPALAAIPGAVAIADALNFVGNVGSDMSPKVREQSEKIVVTAVVAVGAAVQAATGAAVSAASATRKVN